MAILLLLLCVAAVGGAGGILYMLFGPTGPWFVTGARPSYAAIDLRADVPLPELMIEPMIEPAAPVVRKVAAQIAPAMITPEDPGASVTVVDGATDFLDEDAVVELPSAAAIVSLPKLTAKPGAAARAADGTPRPAPRIPSVVPRLGVSAPQKGRHLAPPPRTAIPSLPRTRSARGSDAPTSPHRLRPSAFAPAEVTIKNRVHDMDAEHTVVD